MQLQVSAITYHYVCMLSNKSLHQSLSTGHINGATIASPEGQVMNGPSLTSLVNGIFALVDVGLNDCYGG